MEYYRASLSSGCAIWCDLKNSFSSIFLSCGPWKTFFRLFNKLFRPIFGVTTTIDTARFYYQQCKEATKIAVKYLFQVHNNVAIARFKRTIIDTINCVNTISSDVTHPAELPAQILSSRPALPVIKE